MNNYLVLHFDIEFIVGTVVLDNGQCYPITCNNDNYLWLYFFNNPNHNSVSFGLENKIHFNNSEINYFGNIYQEIENKEECLIRGIKREVIDLFNESGLIEILKSSYRIKTSETINDIPTLISFSSSIGDIPKQIIVDYLTKNRFRLNSLIRPFAELAVSYTLSTHKNKFQNSNPVIFLEATNSTLHFIKLIFSNNSYLVDGEIFSKPGMGFDPRKQALLRFVVTEVSRHTYSLTESQIIEECKRFDLMADSWLRSLDISNRNIPYCIRGVSLSKMPNAKKDLMVRKSDLESDTGYFIQELKNIYETFKNDNIPTKIEAVILFGNCFQNKTLESIIKQTLSNEDLYVYSNKDIHQILPIYTKHKISRPSTTDELEIILPAPRPPKPPLPKPPTIKQDPISTNGGSSKPPIPTPKPNNVIQTPVVPQKPNTLTDLAKPSQNITHVKPEIPKIQETSKRPSIPKLPPKK